MKFHPRKNDIYEVSFSYDCLADPDQLVKLCSHRFLYKISSKWLRVCASRGVCLILKMQSWTRVWRRRLGWASPHPACQRPNSKLCWKIRELGKDHFADFDCKRDQPKIVFFGQKICHGWGVIPPSLQTESIKIVYYTFPSE